MGRKMTSSSCICSSFESPISVSVGAARVFSSRRMITPSPSTVGNTATRMSNRRRALVARTEHASVLGHAMLGDVEPRQHLDPADHTGSVLLRDSFHLLEDPVDPESHDQHIAMWHEVDVARTIVRSLQDDRVHELDRRCVGEAVRSLQVDDVVCVLLHAGHVLPQQGGAGLRLLTAGQPMELGVDVCDGRNPQVDRILADDTQLVHQLKIGWIDDRNLQPSVFEPVRKGSDPE